MSTPEIFKALGKLGIDLASVSDDIENVTVTFADGFFMLPIDVSCKSIEDAIELVARMDKSLDQRFFTATISYKSAFKCEFSEHRKSHFVGEGV